MYSSIDHTVHDFSQRQGLVGVVLVVKQTPLPCSAKVKNLDSIALERSVKLTSQLPQPVLMKVEVTKVSQPPQV